MSKSEYLEKLFGDSFKRESEQDENVARSLPFVAAALTLLVTALNLVGQHLPPFELSIYSLALHALTLAAGVSVAGVLWLLLEAVRPRSYQYPPSETELLAWVGELETYYSTQGITGESLDLAIVADVRSRMVEEWATASVHNRINNAKKLGARAQALSLLSAALAFVFAAAAIMFVFERVARPQSPVSANNGQTTNSKTAGSAASAAAQTAAASVPVHNRGSETSLGERASPSRKQGASQMTESSGDRPAGQPSPAPQPTTQAPKPAAPQPQYFKKNDSGPVERR